MASFQTVQIVELPLQQKQLRELAPELLSDAELLCFVLGARNRVCEAGSEGGGLKALLSLPDAQLERRVGRRDAARFKAAVELGRRSLLDRSRRPILTTPEGLFRYLEPKLMALRREVFHVLALNSRGALLCDRRIAEGSVDSCPVDPREVFAVAVETRASAIVLAHNHPSGSAEPSVQDIELTRNLVAGARLLGTRVVEHLIVGEGRYTSLAERGVIR